jgi:hypothetical protein
MVSTGYMAKIDTLRATAAAARWLLASRMVARNTLIAFFSFATTFTREFLPATGAAAFVDPRRNPIKRTMKVKQSIVVTIEKGGDENNRMAPATRVRAFTCLLSEQKKRRA